MNKVLLSIVNKFLNFIASMGGAMLVELLFIVVRKKFKRQYWEMLKIVKWIQDEADKHDSGEMKAQRAMVKYREFMGEEKLEWLPNLLREVAVGEAKKYQKKV